MILRTDMKKERDRIVNLLTEELQHRINVFTNDASFIIGSFGGLSPRMAEAIGLPDIPITASDAVRIIELLDEILDRVHKQAIEADNNFLRESNRIFKAEQTYRDPRIKNSKNKAVAAVKTLGLTAKDPNYWAEIFSDYERFSPTSTGEKCEAIQKIAERENKTFSAINQGLKREIARRKKHGGKVTFTLPRIT